MTIYRNTLDSRYKPWSDTAPRERGNVTIDEHGTITVDGGNITATELLERIKEMTRGEGIRIDLDIDGTAG